MSKKLSTTVYLERDQRRSLKRISKRTNVPMSALIRRGIDLAIWEMEARLEALERADLV